MAFAKSRFHIAFGLILASTTAALAQSPFSLEQVMGSPFPSELVAAALGSRVAWVFNARGVRNVWVADGPDFIHTARPVTHYRADDGQAIASLRLTPDGKTLLYALGSELNEAQESANPMNWTKGAKQQVFALDVDGKDAAPRPLGEMGCPEEDCEDIEISPDSRWAVWSAKKKLWLSSVDGKQQAKELASVRGAAVQPRWSPDSKHIAFVSQRDTHSFVAVYDFEGDSVRYLAPSVDKDSMPHWSPDGKWIVFVRTAGIEQKQPLIPVRPEPWSLWIADAATGTGRLLWRSGEKPEDPLPELTEDASLNFAEDGRVVFASEQDGRNHLYSIAAGGGTATLREAPNTVGRGAAEYEDVVAAGRYLQSLPEVDGEKIGLWGGSYGGFLTAMGLARNSELFKAGVDFHGVHDWSVLLTERPYFGNLLLRPPTWKLR